MNRARIAIALAMALAASGGVRGEVIDRILAVADGHLVTLSDVRAARQLGFVVPPAGVDPVQFTLDRLINRALMLIEVERYSPPDPDEASVDAALAAVRSRAGGQAQLDAVLAQTGMSPDLLRRHVRDTLRIQAYLDERFGATLRPSDDEVLQYYREHQTEFTRGGTVVPFSEAAGEARNKMIVSRRAALIETWAAGLRRRAEVTVMYLPSRSPGG